uniref:Pseudouridylate synthase RPUSD2 n=1 Tax=Timema tahoe TaxID=61484 RepID=A0A7R9NW54_9NEOP|nr:unnamed protein product [Timema tahoe]
MSDDSNKPLKESKVDKPFSVDVGTLCVSRKTVLEESIVVLKQSYSDNETSLDSSDEGSSLVEKEGVSIESHLIEPSGEKRKTDDLHTNKKIKKPRLNKTTLKIKRPGFSDDRYDETAYYFENSLRKVYPYYFTFTTFTKGRWVGEKILDVFAREFRAHPAEEYERCIKTGMLTVNHEHVSVDYKLKHNDLLSNTVHRHEVPVTSESITIVHLDQDIVVVDKPSSIPVHPCGRYRHNTVVFILAKEYNLRNLRTLHRIDRLTSGVLLFGRTSERARTIEQQIRDRQVQKEYICCVEGDFPDGIVECNEAIEVVSFKIGVCRVSPKGKPCMTSFQKLEFNGKTSIVSCKPHTGRMHQIRVHLQFLGYPIINDPLYNHTVFGPEKGRGGNTGKTNDELVRDLISIHNADNWLGVDIVSELCIFKPLIKDLSKDMLDTDICVTKQEPSRGGETSVTSASISPLSPSQVTVAIQTGHEEPDASFDPSKTSCDPNCHDCKVHYRDPLPSDLVMYLHAWKYQGPGWCYQTQLPDWAQLNEPPTLLRINLGQIIQVIMETSQEFVFVKPELQVGPNNAVASDSLKKQVFDHPYPSSNSEQCHQVGDNLGRKLEDNKDTATLLAYCFESSIKEGVYTNKHILNSTNMSDKTKQNLLQKCNQQIKNVSSVPEKDEKFECHHCGQILCNKKYLTRHIGMFCFVVPKTVKCDDCGRYFKNGDYLKKHSIIHRQQKPHNCDECGKGFSKLRYLKEHNLYHRGVKLFKCDLCGKCFTKKVYLASHSIVHSLAKPHKCEECGKCFGRKNHYNRHKLIHKDERRHKCEECGRTFRYSHHLTSHKLIHMNEKPHRCEVCGKCFRLKSLLGEHMHVHGEKTHKCDECGRCYSRKRYLMRHAKIHIHLSSHYLVS